jgi:peptide/nickel transport system ATP-binding protein
MAPLLELRDLVATVPTGSGPARVLEGVSLSLARGETLGLVGESGCGKSMTALSIMGLAPAAMRLSGSIAFDGQDLLQADEATLCRLRGRRMAMIFQEPMTALNPLRSIGAQIAEGLRLHLALGRAEAAERTRALLDRVGLPAPRFSPQLYPHQLSGGQRQRVMIAMALACDPVLLIADEPTTALDVTIQKQILDLLRSLVEDSDMALMLITHDLGVVAQLTARVAVMYAGRIVETGATADVFAAMAHPYTRGLFAASPHAVAPAARAKHQRLATIAGAVPDPLHRPPGCRFAPRCPRRQADCLPVPPPLLPMNRTSHLAACLHPHGAVEPVRAAAPEAAP